MQSYKPENPLIVQSDKSVLLEVDNPLYTEARDALARFAELEKSPEYVHTYRISSLSLWNAAAAGLTAQQILDDLERYSKYPLPDNVRDRYYGDGIGALWAHQDCRLKTARCWSLATTSR